VFLLFCFTLLLHSTCIWLAKNFSINLDLKIVYNVVIECGCISNVSYAHEAAKQRSNSGSRKDGGRNSKHSDIGNGNLAGIVREKRSILRMHTQGVCWVWRQVVVGR
jgi:hypothetical protein